MGQGGGGGGGWGGGVGGAGGGGGVGGGGGGWGGGLYSRLPSRGLNLPAETWSTSQAIRCFGLFFLTTRVLRLLGICERFRGVHTTRLPPLRSTSVASEIWAGKRAGGGERSSNGGGGLCM